MATAAAAPSIKNDKSVWDAATLEASTTGYFHLLSHATETALQFQQFINNAQLPEYAPSNWKENLSKLLRLLPSVFYKELLQLTDSEKAQQIFVKFTQSISNQENGKKVKDFYSKMNQVVFECGIEVILENDNLDPGQEAVQAIVIKKLEAKEIQATNKTIEDYIWSLSHLIIKNKLPNSTDDSKYEEQYRKLIQFQVGKMQPEEMTECERNLKETYEEGGGKVFYELFTKAYVSLQLASQTSSNSSLLVKAYKYGKSFIPGLKK